MSSIKVAGYCRVSTNKEDQANSFEAQQRFFRDYVEQKPEWELYDIYADEGITGTSTKKRIRFNEMIRDAYDGRFQMILTKEVSRFSRNILDTISYTRELRAIGVSVIFMTDRINTLNPESEMLLSFLGSLAQEESRRTSGRVVWGQTRQMERGVVFGRSMLGYDLKNGVLNIEPGGAELIRLIFHKYAVEQLGTTQIARYLEKEGFCTYRGSQKWTPGGIVKILKNEKYVGDLVQKKSYTPDYLTHEKKRNKGQVPLIKIHNHHEPIVSREVWDLAQKRLESNRKNGANHPAGGTMHTFSGKIKCGECGSSFVARTRYRKDGTAVRRWACSNAVRNGASACSIGRLLGEDEAEALFQTAIQNAQIDRDQVISEVISLVLPSIKAGTGDAEARGAKLQKELELRQKKKEAVLDSYFSGDITRDDMLAMKRAYERETAALQQLIAEKKRGEEWGTTEENITKVLYGVLTGEIVCGIFCKTLLESITVFQDRHTELRFKHLPHVFRFH